MDTSQKNLPRDIYFRDAIYDLEQIKNTLTYSTLHAFSPISLHTPRVSTWREIKKIPLYAAFAWFWTRRLTIGKTDEPTRRPSALATRGKLRVLRDNDQFNFVWLPDFQIKLHLLQVHTCTCSIIFTKKKTTKIDRSRRGCRSSCCCIENSLIYDTQNVVF